MLPQLFAIFWARYRGQSRPDEGKLEEFYGDGSF